MVAPRDCSMSIEQSLKKNGHLAFEMSTDDTEKLAQTIRMSLNVDLEQKHDFTEDEGNDENQTPSRFV